MGWNDRIDFDLSEKLDAIIEVGYLEEGTPAYGIAKLVSASGEGVLSEKQRYAYENVVLPALERSARNGIF